MVEFASFALVFTGTSLEHEFASGCAAQFALPSHAHCDARGGFGARNTPVCDHHCCRYKIPADVLDFDYAGKARADPMAVCAPSPPARSVRAHCIHALRRNRYPLFRAWFRYEALGKQSSGAAPDFKAIVGMVCGDLGVPPERLAPGYEEEIQRSWDAGRGGPVEIATVASVIGGIAANEAVKHIVQKFQPINNTIIYDGANLEYSLDFKL